MTTLDVIANFLCNVYFYTLSFAKTIHSTVVTIISVNYSAVTSLVDTLSFVAEKLRTTLQVLFYVVTVLITALTDFFVECYNFVYALILLLWKFILLLLSILDLVFRGCEQLAYFIWSGGVWTAGAFKTSLIQISEASATFYDTGQHLLGHLSTGVSSWFSALGNGLNFLGKYSFDAAVFIFSTFKWIITEVLMFIDNAMMAFADGIRYIVDSVYYFITDTVTGATKETYYGIMMIVILYFLIINLCSVLFHRGMTFPFMTNTVPHNRRPNFPLFNGRNEFSDDENSQDGDEEEDDHSDTDSDVTVGDDDDDDESGEGSDEEFSVVDDSDEDDASNEGSETSSQFSDIDVQLPNENERRYNLRRSATPSLSKVASPEEFDKELEREREKNQCVVCQDNKKSVLILPCKHMCLCIDCGHRIARSRSLNRRTCPLCRQRIRTIMNVYV